MHIAQSRRSGTNYGPQTPVGKVISSEGVSDKQYELPSLSIWVNRETIGAVVTDGKVAGREYRSVRPPRTVTRQANTELPDGQVISMGPLGST